MRVFSPIADFSKRSRVIEYCRFGTAVDMRLVCVLPHLLDVVLCPEMVPVSLAEYKTVCGQAASFSSTATGNLLYYAS